MLVFPGKTTPKYRFYFLKNLVTKNYLKPVSEGRIHKYEISVTQENYKKHY